MDACRSYRRKLPHIRVENRPHFVTFRTKNGWQLPPAARTIVLECCVYVHARTATLHAAVVMPDHVHLLLTPSVCENGDPFLLERILKGIKGTSARGINKALHRSGSVWQPESFDHFLRSSESAQAKAGYILANPVRRGLAERNRDYGWTWRLAGRHGRHPGRCHAHHSACES